MRRHERERDRQRRAKLARDRTSRYSYQVSRIDSCVLPNIAPRLREAVRNGQRYRAQDASAVTARPAELRRTGRRDLGRADERPVADRLAHDERLDVLARSAADAAGTSRTQKTSSSPSDCCRARSTRRRSSEALATAASIEQSFSSAAPPPPMLHGCEWKRSRGMSATLTNSLCEPGWSICVNDRRPDEPLRRIVGRLRLAADAQDGAHGRARRARGAGRRG